VPLGSALQLASPTAAKLYSKGVIHPSEMAMKAVSATHTGYYQRSGSLSRSLPSSGLPVVEKADLPQAPIWPPTG